MVARGQLSPLESHKYKIAQPRQGFHGDGQSSHSPAKTSPESKEKTFSIAASETEFFILL
jgi:hypothetical protein